MDRPFATIGTPASAAALSQVVEAGSQGTTIRLACTSDTDDELNLCEAAVLIFRGGNGVIWTRRLQAHGDAFFVAGADLLTTGGGRQFV